MAITRESTIRNSEGVANSENDCDSYSSETVKLKKQLGLMNGVGIIIGIIIGSGIFVSPRGVFESTESIGLALVVWVSCGLLSLCGALCYAELGTSIPKSGGEFAYLHESFGGLSAFLFLWVALLIITPTGNAIIALTFAEYALEPAFPGCKPPDQAVRLLAAAVILLLTFINCYNVKWATTIQDFFACAKLVALAIIIIVGIVVMSLGGTENFSRPFENSSTNVKDIATAFYSGMFSYSGWNCLNYVTEELKKPTRNLPRAIYISVPLVTLVYFLTNVAYFAVLTRSEILSSIAVAGTFGEKTLGVMSWIMPFFVAISTFGGLNGCIFSSARLFFVGARQGHLPNAVAMINVNHLTPSPSLIFLALITIIYLWSGQISVLITFTQFIESLCMTTVIAGLLWLRVKEPNRKRPVMVNTAIPVIFLMVGILLVVLPFYKFPMETGIGLAITVSGIPAYLIFVCWKKKPGVIIKISDAVTKLIQKLLLCSPQERKTTCDEQIRMIDEYFEKLEERPQSFSLKK